MEEQKSETNIKSELQSSRVKQTEIQNNSLKDSKQNSIKKRNTETNFRQLRDNSYHRQDRPSTEPRDEELLSISRDQGSQFMKQEIGTEDHQKSSFRKLSQRNRDNGSSLVQSQAEDLVVNKNAASFADMTLELSLNTFQLHQYQLSRDTNSNRELNFNLTNPTKDQYDNHQSSQIQDQSIIEQEEENNVLNEVNQNQIAENQQKQEKEFLAENQIQAEPNENQINIIDQGAEQHNKEPIQDEQLNQESINDEQHNSPINDEQHIQDPMNDEQNNKIPNNDEQNNQLPITDEQQNQAPILVEQHNQDPMNDEQNNKIPNNDEQNNQLPNNDEEHNQEPINDEQHNQDPMNDEQNNKIPNNDEQNNQLPITDEQQNQAPILVEQHNQDPMNDEQNNKIPITDEQNNQLPITDEQQDQAPIIVEQHIQDPMNDEQNNQLPNNDEQNNQVPIIVEQHNQEPINDEQHNQKPINNQEQNQELINDEQQNQEIKLDEQQNQKVINDEQPKIIQPEDKIVSKLQVPQKIDVPQIQQTKSYNFDELDQKNQIRARSVKPEEDDNEVQENRLEMKNSLKRFGDTIKNIMIKQQVIKLFRSKSAKLVSLIKQEPVIIHRYNSAILTDERLKKFMELNNEAQQKRVIEQNKLSEDKFKMLPEIQIITPTQSKMQITETQEKPQEEMKQLDTQEQSKDVAEQIYFKSQKSQSSQENIEQQDIDSQVQEQLQENKSMDNQKDQQPKLEFEPFSYQQDDRKRSQSYLLDDLDRKNMIRPLSEKPIENAEAIDTIESFKQFAEVAEAQSLTQKFTKQLKQNHENYRLNRHVQDKGVVIHKYRENRTSESFSQLLQAQVKKVESMPQLKKEENDLPISQDNQQFQKNDSEQKYEQQEVEIDEKSYTSSRQQYGIKQEDFYIDQESKRKDSNNMNSFYRKDITNIQNNVSDQNESSYVEDANQIFTELEKKNTILIEENVQNELSIELAEVEKDIQELKLMKPKLQSIPNVINNQQKQSPFKPNYKKMVDIADNVEKIYEAKILVRKMNQQRMEQKQRKYKQLQKIDEQFNEIFQSHLYKEDLKSKYEEQRKNQILNRIDRYHQKQQENLELQKISNNFVKQLMEYGPKNGQLAKKVENELFKVKGGMRKMKIKDIQVELPRIQQRKFINEELMKQREDEMLQKYKQSKIHQMIRKSNQ